MTRAYEVIPTGLVIWSVGGGKYVGAVKDKRVVERLKALDGQKVILRIQNIVLTTRVTTREINSNDYVVFFLPRSLNPTWAWLRTRGEVDAEVIIPRDETGLAIINDGGG
jgi:hypothetical protein